MSAATRPRVRARFRIGPWVPGLLLPAVLGLVGVAASVLALEGVLLPVGIVLAVVAAARVRSPAPWLLVVALVLGQLLRAPSLVGVELSALVLAVHLVVALTLLARAVPARSRLQVAALGPAALAVGLVQVPAQLLAAALLTITGRLQPVPIAATVGAALLVLVAGLLIVPRRHEE